MLDQTFINAKFYLNTISKRLDAIENSSASVNKLSGLDKKGMDRKLKSQRGDVDLYV